MGFSNIHSDAKQQKIERGKNFSFRKKSDSADKNCKEDSLGFSHIHSDAKQQKKLKGGPFGGNFFSKKKSRSAKKMKGGPFGLARLGCYAEKQEKPFWFSSLGQIVQFGAIIFCRTFKNYFGQFVWIEKKTRTSKVGAISKAQKAQNIFLEKKLVVFETKILSKKVA